jgi:multidrug efflux pump subunit AcrA (membrane-fusion protein)
MATRPRWATLLILSSTLLNSFSYAQEKSAAKAGTAKDEGPLVPRATVKVEKGRLATSVTVKGTVEGDSTTEVRVPLKSWPGPLVVDKAIEHGAQVKKDDVLLTFDAEKITQLLRATREERELAKLAIKQAELDLPLLKQHLPLDLQTSEREKKESADDLQRFLKVDKPRQIEEAQFALKSGEFNVESAKDELAQLEKMYRDKDLTEETEQMILKRYKHSLEMAEFSLRGTKLRTERSLTIDLPRREQAAQLAATKADLAWEKAREQLPLQLRQKELALEKLRFDENRAQEKLADLEKDVSLMTIKAPAAGVVYYGRYARGQWSGPVPTAYLKGGTLPANDVVMTIISNGRLFLHAEVDEKEVADLKAGQAARISPTRSPSRKLIGQVHRVAAIPQGGKFEVLIALTGESLTGIVPGLTGSAKIMTAQKENALSVPSSAVFEDPDTEMPYVYLPGDKPKKKAVKTGLVAGDKTEIVEGLSEGDEILAAKP